MLTDEAEAAPPRLVTFEGESEANRVVQETGGRPAAKRRVRRSIRAELRNAPRLGGFQRDGSNFWFSL